MAALPSRLTGNRGTRTVLITGSAQDDGGLATVSFSVTDEYGRDQPTIDGQDLAGATQSTWQRSVSLDTSLHSCDRARHYTITATVTDLAGNVTTSSTQVVVIRSRSTATNRDPEPQLAASHTDWNCVRINDSVAESTRPSWTKARSLTLQSRPTTAPSSTCSNAQMLVRRRRSCSVRFARMDDDAINAEIHLRHHCRHHFYVVS